MFEGKKIIAIIPARGGSKGIPRKNIRLLAGKPLLAYSIDGAKKSVYIDRIVVSTEDDEIAQISKKYGAEVVRRPPELAEDASPTLPSLQHVLEQLKNTEEFVPDIVLTLQATSPLRLSTHIDDAIEKYYANNVDSLHGVNYVYEHRFELNQDGNTIVPVNGERVPRQNRKPVILENGFLYISKKELIEAGRILGDKILPFVVDKKFSVDIDDPHDFFIAEQIILNYPEYGNENR